MQPRRALSLLVIVLAGALLIGCGKKSEPAPSGVSTATPSPTASAIETPKPAASATATAAATSQIEATLKKALLQPDDLPGTNWSIQDAGMRELAEAARAGGAQQAAKAGQDLITACYPDQPATAANATPEAVSRFFAQPPDGLTSVMSLVMRDPAAQQTVKAGQTTSPEELRPCIQTALQKSVSAQLPGATVEIVQLTAVGGLPANATGMDAAFRISASGLVLTQHIASVSVAQDEIVSTALMIAMAEGTAIPPLPATPARIGSTAAQRLTEALR